MEVFATERQSLDYAKDERVGAIDGNAFDYWEKYGKKRLVTSNVTSNGNGNVTVMVMDQPKSLPNRYFFFFRYYWRFFVLAMHGEG